MPTFTDTEFGEITVRSSQQSSRVSMRIAPNGRLRISTPPHTPLFAVKMILKTSRSDIRSLFEERNAQRRYDHDQSVGKSHSLVINHGATATHVELVGTKIIVDLATTDDIHQPHVQDMIRQIILKVLRKEAKSYLPRRLAYLADEHGFHYESVKLTHASSRWGSCSSRGTISLNISLMQLPFELLDYVLVHELSHTREMNHSSAFWNEVGAIDPQYKAHRTALKKHSPNI